MREDKSPVDSNNRANYTRSSGNVFKDLDLPDAEELLLKAKLGFEVFQIIEKWKLTQTQAAKILGVKQPEISRLKQGKFNHYGVERLMTFLNRLNHDIEIRIIPSEDRRGTTTGHYCLVLAFQYT